MKEPREVTLMGDAESDGRWIRVFGWGPGLGYKIWSGNYKLVYGTPRKLWDPREPGKALFEAYEIEGEFDAKDIKWRRAKMKVKVEATGEVTTIDVEDWTFSLYEGDKLYFEDGTLLLSCEFADNEKGGQGST
ncbi:MAG: hypothetical protein RML36_17050 [Anaerolineae bacterium]|nr:hypothetical protein [Anaerolineae bacterium]